MATLTRAVSIVRDPVRSAYALAGRARPEALWDAYEKRCRAAGIDRPTFVLSLDCDTTRDIEVGGDVHGRLSDAGITPVYAVPGELLEAGAATYGSIAASGAEFVNHGYAEHTRLEDGRYRSFFFYDRLPADVVRRDVERGDAAVTAVLGTRPRGFRTPHFGSFQRPDQLRALHGVLADLGYRYSTSTTPLAALRHGPITDRWGVQEIAVSGCPTWPLGILDTFGFRFAPGRTVGEADYLREAATLADRLDEGRPLFVNLYADPSQVHDWPPFFSAMARFAPHAVESYSALLDRLGR